MELRDLRAFAASVETGAITRAAERLHLVQSAVSQAVRRLERELGVMLLERRPDGVRPTEAGALLVDHARLIANAVAHAERDMNGFREVSRGTVRVGVLYTAVPTILVPLLRAVSKELPGIELEIEEGLATAVGERVRLGYLDIGVFFLPTDVHGLLLKELRAIDLTVLVPTDHPLAGRRRVALSRLLDETWIAFPAPNPGRAWLDAALASSGSAPGKIIAVETLGAVKAFVGAGRGVALMPRGAADVEERAGLLKVISLAEATPQTVLASATRPGEPSPAVHAVVRVLEATAAALP
jgi:DNA-binding transcriptional LysR family regulator